MTELEQQVLDFEARHPVPGGAKDAAIRQVFGCSPTTYHQRLMALLDDPAALAHAPTLIGRLRRVRDTRRRQRATA